MATIEEKLAKVSVTHPSPAEVLRAIPQKEVKRVYRYESGTEEERIKTTVATAYLLREIEFTGIRYLCEDLSKKNLARLLDNIEIDHKAAGNNPNSRRVLYKRVLEQMSSQGIEAFLKDNVDVALLTDLIHSVDLKPKSSKKADLVEQLTSELQYQGMYSFFESLPLDLLHDVTFAMKLEDPEGETSSKQLLIEAIFTNEKVNVPEKSKKTAPKFSKKKQSIKKGITYDDIFQHYNVEELVEWCKKNELKVTGAKPELINRILSFLEGDKENTLAGTKRKAKRKKAVPWNSRQKRVAMKKKDAEGKATKPKAPVKKAQETKSKEDTKSKSEEKKAEVKKAEEKVEVPKKSKDSETLKKKKSLDEETPVEESTPTEELVLDDLSSYPLQRLKAYCEEEALVVKGKTKKDYIDAILAHNEGSDEEGDEESDEEADE